MTGIDALLASLPPWTLVGGKGGVGKTTCAAALALRSARDGARTLVLSTDPAGTLADVLESPLGGEPHAVAAVDSLSACQLDATTARTDFLAKWGSVLATIIDRGTYLDRDDIQGLIDAALPGIDETMAFLTLADLADRNDWQRVILDTAPTGHTLRLLALPETFEALIGLLDTMQAKHRFMVSALMHRYRPDEADSFLADLRAKVAKLRALMTDPGRMGVLLVSRPEPVVVAETVRYATQLTARRVSVRAVLMNATPDATAPATLAALAAVRHAAPHAEFFTVGELGDMPAGAAGLERWAGSVRQPRARDAKNVASHGRPRRAQRASGAGMLARAAPFIETLPPLLIVGGKGGVGKTSVSCAIALARARTGHHTFLVSTDPAPSIADALDHHVGDADCVLPDAFGLAARQIDATAAFARWRAEYESRVDSAFDALLGPGLDAAHDRAVARQLLALAPPGIDELYALIWLGDALAEQRFERIVVDPAPTGHLIRLLEMPALALDWAHRLLRLMLKYRELAGGGDLAADLLAFARRTRAVSALLNDAQQSAVLVVALEEPVVRLEASRIVDRVRALGAAVPALVWNRVSALPRPLPVEPPVRQFVAAAATPPPVGARRLLAWYDEWGVLERDA
jgi:arsenite/tail-anchored protein-transporting ATPase